LKRDKETRKPLLVGRYSSVACSSVFFRSFSGLVKKGILFLTVKSELGAVMTGNEREIEFNFEETKSSVYILTLGEETTFIEPTCSNLA
jgi:hypothetical protein